MYRRFAYYDPPILSNLNEIHQAAMVDSMPMNIILVSMRPDSWVKIGGKTTVANKTCPALSKMLANLKI